MRRTRGQQVLATAILAKPDDPIYGYDMSRRTGVRSGVMYPLLHRWLEAGLLEDRWDQSWSPPRRFYRLTPKGQLELSALIVTDKKTEPRR